MIIDRTRITISVLVLLVLLGGYVLLSRSARETQKKLEVEYAQLYERVQRERRLVKNFEVLKARRDSLLQVYKEQLTLMPETQDMTTFLDEVSAYGVRSGIEFLLFRPMPPVVRGFYTEFPVDVKITGTYHQLGKFLSLLANAPRLITIENLQILSLAGEGTPEEERGIYTVTAQFILKTYAFTKPSTPSTPVVAQKGGQP